MLPILEIKNTNENIASLLRELASTLDTNEIKSMNNWTELLLRVCLIKHINKLKARSL